jgi:hypothetical protein
MSGGRGNRFAANQCDQQQRNQKTNHESLQRIPRMRTYDRVAMNGPQWPLRSGTTIANLRAR